MTTYQAVKSKLYDACRYVDAGELAMADKAVREAYSMGASRNDVANILGPKTLKALREWSVGAKA